MTAEPVTARVDSGLAEAVLFMDEAGVQHIPVVDSGGRPVGIVTQDDVLHVLARGIRQLRPTTPRGS
jgi:CBS domain-containing protein